jgi:hypothetical protein
MLPCKFFSLKFESYFIDLIPPQSQPEKEEGGEVLKPERRRRSQNVVKHDIALNEVKGDGIQVSGVSDTREGSETDVQQKEALQQRVRLEDCYTWQCTDCPTVLATLQELKDHHHLAHGQPVRFQCIECAKVYAVYKKFTRHVRLHRNHGKYRYS